METLPKLHDMLKAALEKAAQECGTLLGQNLELSETSTSGTISDAYFNAMENASFVIAIESQGDYPGTFYLVIPFRDAIVLSGTLLGVPPGRIMEKRRLAILEPDDVDAFSEIANQLIGSFNPVFKQCLPKKIHLKQHPPKKFIPNDDTIAEEEPVPAGEYYLLQAQLKMPGQDLELVDLLIPLPLASLFDLQDVQNEELQEIDGEADTIPDEAPVAAEVAEVAAEQSRTVLILDDNAVERQQFQEALSVSGVNPVTASLSADLKKMLAQGGVQAVLLGVDNAEEQELSLCLKIQANAAGGSIPIILCARQWTRTGVLKALKNGAREILLKPCLPDELTTKVLKLMNAA